MSNRRANQSGTQIAAFSTADSCQDFSYTTYASEDAATGSEVRKPAMPRGDKSKYTEKQKRKAEHIEEGYKKQGVSEKEAERRAWATVNATDRGGKKPGGSGRGKRTNKAPSRK